jgi:hypothetical protein
MLIGLFAKAYTRLMCYRQKPIENEVLVNECFDLLYLEHREMLVKKLVEASCIICLSI